MKGVMPSVKHLARSPKSVERSTKGLRRSVAAALIALPLLPLAPAHAAFEVRWPDARSAAMLTGGLDLTGRSLLSRSTADGTRPVPARRAVLSAGELFGLSEARGWCARASTPVRDAAVALEISSLGGELYHERQAGIFVRWLAAPDTEVGVGGRCLGIGARGEPGLWAAALDAAATRRVLGRVLLGARCANLTGSEIGDSPVASTSAFGLAIALPEIVLQVGALMQDGLEAATSLGFEAALSEWLRIRAGASSSPGMLGAGLGVGRIESRDGQTRPLVRPTLDLAWQWHPKLGGSSFVSVEVWF
jgi:hypothetical protein